MKISDREMPPSSSNSNPTTKARWNAVYDAIRAAILSRTLAPGTKLPEDELAEIYQVSRTVVRAALQALGHDRLVLIETNKGASVERPTKRDAREVFEARALIEPRVAALAAQIAKPSDIRRLRAHLEEEHAAIHSGKDVDAVSLSARFHVAIAEIADHKTLADMVRTLCSRSALIISIYWIRHDAICEKHAHHELVNAIERHDQAAAAELMTSHLTDLLSGLDLDRPERTTLRLADVLDGFGQKNQQRVRQW